MTKSNDFKVGVTIEVDNAIYPILEFQHVKPGKRAAIVKTELKNLRTGSIIAKTFTAGEKVALARIEKKNMQFLYEMNGTYYFMNMTTYEQIELDKSLVEYESKFLKENLEVIMMFYGDEVLGITLPDKVVMKVVRTEAAVKGNTTNSAMKDAEVETGLVVKVPLFINQDEEILISTKDGKYVSRA